MMMMMMIMFHMLQMLEAEERQRAIYRLTFNLTNELTQNGLIGTAECQHIIQNHLTVSCHLP